MIRFLRHRPVRAPRAPRQFLAAMFVASAACVACAHARAGTPPSPGAASAATASVEVNTANAAELDALRGVGPSLSGRILEARRAGAFSGWPDLLRRVKGIRAAKAAQLSAAGLTVRGEPYRQDAP